MFCSEFYRIAFKSVIKDESRIFCRLLGYI